MAIKVLNPDYPVVLKETVDYLAEAVITGEHVLGIPISGTLLNGYLFSCGRAQILDTPEEKTLEVSLLGTSRDSSGKSCEQSIAISIPPDRAPGHLHLLRRLKFGISDLLNESVTTGFAHTWDPEQLERLAGLDEQIDSIREILEDISDCDDEAELDGHAFQRIAGHWVWTGRAA